MKKLKYLLLALLLSGISTAYSQVKKVADADKKFENLQYIDAIYAYEAIVQNGYESEDVFQKLGDANYFNADYTKAAGYYEHLFLLNENQLPEYLFRYGQSLKSIQDYKKADYYLTKFYQSVGGQYSNSEDFVDKLKTSQAVYTIEKASFNTDNSDYPAFMANDQLFVVSGNGQDLINPWSGEPTSDIYKLSDSSLSPMNTKINTKYNEGSLVITKDGNTMYFTRNNYLRKVGISSEKTINLKLYKATKINGDWDNIIELPFNSDQYSVGHPALDEANNMLYFVSDMITENLGGTDIYSVIIKGNNIYGSVTNVRALNTIGNEMFPFVSADRVFYYSSNGIQPNIGGLDVYSATMEDNTFKDITNLGEPINSPFDDFAFVTDGSKSDLSGYFSSNRIGSSSDDVYKFIKTPKCDQIIAGIVKDKKTGDYLPNAIVSLIDGKNIVVESMVADEFGNYKFENVGCDDTVRFVRGEQPEYQTNEVALPIEIEKRKSLDVLLDRRGIEGKIGDDIGKLLNPIYFDLDKSNIRPDAEIELQKVIAILKQYPTINIDIRSHTDSRANDDYNMSLSERRARSTVDYIVNRGSIASSRVTGKGYGESQLTNGCDNGSKCTEAEHQQNRRSEFIIFK